MERCLSLIIREMKIKTAMSTSAYQSEGPSLKSLQITNVGEGIEKRETFYTVGWNWYSHYGTLVWRFLDSSVGKESTSNAGDPSLIPGSGRSSGEGIGYPLQYSWASLVAQLVKNPPAMQETWV